MLLGLVMRQACGSGGRWERALLLLQEMEEDGSTPGIKAFHAALEALKGAGQWEKVSDAKKGRLNATYTGKKWQEKRKCKHTIAKFSSKYTNHMQIKPKIRC